MPYEYLPEVAIADIAFRAWGRTLEEAFVAAADATLNAMIDNLEAIRPAESCPIRLQNEALDLLLFDLLQEIIYHKDAGQLLLRVHEPSIRQESGEWVLTAEGQGEKLDPQRHHQRVDVKAVTLHRFQLEQSADGWTAQVILDI